MATLHYLLLAAVFLAAAAAARGHNAAKDIVRASCVHASYPTLCVRTLSTYSGPAITTPSELAQVAVKISLSHARRAALGLATLRKSAAAKRRERSALEDCLEQLSDSVDELSWTLGALKQIRNSGGGAGATEFRWELSNAETWVSAALTNEDTCLDGIDGVDGQIKSKVKKKITRLARITSNALYMINQLDGRRGKAYAVHP